MLHLRFAFKAEKAYIACMECRHNLAHFLMLQLQALFQLIRGLKCLEQQKHSANNKHIMSVQASPVDASICHPQIPS